MRNTGQSRNQSLPANFNNADLCSRGNNSGQCESRLLKQCLVFILCPLFASWYEQHNEIQKFTAERLITWRNYAFNDKQLFPRSHCSVTVLKNGHALFFVPIMDDVPHQIGVRPGRHRFKKVAADKLTAVNHALTSQSLPGSLDYMRQIEEDAPHILVLLENGGQLR